MSDRIINPEKALARLREIEGQVGTINGDLATVIAEAKADAGRLLAPLETERKGIAAALEAHFTANRKGIFLGGEKFVDYPSGRVGFRKGQPSISIPAKIAATLWDRAVEVLGPYAAATCFKVTYKPLKAELAKLSDDLLAKLGIKRKAARDEFYYDLSDKPGGESRAAV